MRRGIIATLGAVLTLAVFQSPAMASASFGEVLATTAGQSLLINFEEQGLQPGQNYAYTGSGTVRLTFQCYRTKSFTPVDHKKRVTGGVSPDPRAYTANHEGVVAGFIYFWPDVAWPDFCRRGQESVPIRVCYWPEDIVDFVQPFDVYWFPDGTKICGPVEPD